MPDKKHILKAIASLAKQLGHTPSILEFAAHTEISKSSLFLVFPKWNDAVRAAGLQPNRLHVRAEDAQLLQDWGEMVRKMRAFPSRWAYRREGKFYPLTLEKRFGGWDSVPHAFRKFAKGKREWADVLALLPALMANDYSVQPAWKPQHPRPRARQTGSGLQLYPGETLRRKFKNRATYGSPIHFPSFRHEPVNEQGVVLLFGMLAKDLGYIIEAAQKEFPDCEAKREIAPGRWQRVNIEFEYESKNFRDHGHPVNRCDLIVCWRHNWEDCPKHIEILELSSVIKSLAQSEDCKTK